MKNTTLTLWIFIALISGIIVGAVAPDFAVKMHPLATIFLRMVKNAPLSIRSMSRTPAAEELPQAS